MSKKTPAQVPKRSVDWPPFELKLGDTLSRLEEDQYLVISVKRSNRYVQFAGQGSYGLRAEVVSNRFLSKPEKLDRRQTATLKRIGWIPPTGKPSQSTPERDPDGSPNHFVDFKAPVAFDQVARLAVTTLVEILEVPHPGMMEYEAFDADHNALAMTGLGLRRASRAADASKDDSAGHTARIAGLLRETLRKLTGISTLEFDADGDIGVMYGSAVVFARVMGDPPAIRLCAPLVTDIELEESHYQRLNEINGGSNLLRYVERDGRLFGMVDIPAAEFVDANVAQAFEQACRLADSMDDLLQAEFGGRAREDNRMPSALRH